MFKKIEFNWENSFFALLWAAGFMSLLGASIFVAKNKFTHQYSLGSDHGVLTITKEMNWYEDTEIKLDRSVTYSEAIRMIDSLNATLRP